MSTGGGKGDLSVNAKDLAAIGDEAFTLYQRLSRDGDHPKKSTGKAAADLKGDFKLGGALSDVIEKWGKQVDSVRDACAHISNHLDYTKKAHAGDEYHISSKLSLISLQTGFDERSQR
ncbi:hypothetical protein [Streptomyces sp. NPDC005438]|uniref:hypothetical protein n=1 Tax=Streptomyces sp. NPDC005438 TaxID=3156880 RepID=UPI0033B495EA